MRDYELRERIHRAMDTRLPGIREDPYFARRILAEARGGKKVKRKISVGLVLGFVLLFVAATATAAILLSIRQIVDERAVPMANEYQGESYTLEDTSILLQLAEENGIELSQNTKDQIAKAAAQGEGYYKEELIMAMAKAEFGENPVTWTLEEQKWFDDVCVAIGFIASPEKKLPDESVISPEEAVSIAQRYIEENYGGAYDLNDTGVYRQGLQLIDGTKNAEHDVAYYTVVYEPLMLEAPEYWIYVSDCGEILDARATIGVSEGATYSEIEDRFTKIYGFDMTKWSQSILQAFRAALDRCEPTNSRAYLSFIKVSYPDIDENAIRKEQAEDIGAQALGITDYSLDSAVYVESDGTVIWRICYIVKGEEDTYIRYFADIECFTGEVLCAGRQIDRWWMYCYLVPQNVCDEVLRNWVDDRPANG